jgi:hypothetical protein
MKLIKFSSMMPEKLLKAIKRKNKKTNLPIWRILYDSLIKDYPEAKE